MILRERGIGWAHLVLARQVSPVTDEDAAFVEWFATFDCDKADIGQWQSFFAQNIFKPGLDSLKKKAAAK